MLAWLLTHGREGELRERILSFAALENGGAVLDIGCGTGTLAIAASRHVGTAGEVIGIDASPAMVAREITRVLKSGGRVLAVDFGRGKQRALLAHFHRHGHVDVHDIVTLFEEAGLTPVRTGPVGMNNLDFVLAEATPRERRDRGACA